MDEQVAFLARAVGLPVPEAEAGRDMDAAPRARDHGAPAAKAGQPRRARRRDAAAPADQDSA